MRLLASTLLISALVVTLWSPTLAGTNDSSKKFELNDGSTIVGIEIDQLDTGYLIRTADGATIRLPYEDVARVTELPDPLPSEEPVQQSNELPAQQSNEQPAQQSNEQPAQQSNEQPAQQGDEQPAQQSNEQPAQQTTEDQSWARDEPADAPQSDGWGSTQAKNKCRVLLALGSGAAIHSVSSFVGGFTAAAVFTFGTASANFWGGGFTPSVTGDHLPTFYGDQYTPAFSTGMALVGVSMTMLGVGHELGKKSLWHSTWKSRRSTKAAATLVGLGYPLWIIGYGGFIASYVMLTQNLRNYEETIIAPPIVSAVLMVVGHALAAGGALKVHQAAAESISTMTESSVARPVRRAPRLALAPWIAPNKSGLSFGLGGLF
ncbi:MAG: hypothetical protein CL928_01925 [Deltaproteobacteria bacterium]|nr:hypothetical protein [Deltaproteobacteria bacterium]